MTVVARFAISQAARGLSCAAFVTSGPRGTFCTGGRALTGVPHCRSPFGSPCSPRAWCSSESWGAKDESSGCPPAAQVLHAFRWGNQTSERTNRAWRRQEATSAQKALTFTQESTSELDWHVSQRGVLLTRRFWFGSSDMGPRCFVSKQLPGGSSGPDPRPQLACQGPGVGSCVLFIDGVLRQRRKTCVRLPTHVQQEGVTGRRRARGVQWE